MVRGFREDPRILFDSIILQLLFGRRLARYLLRAG